MAKRVNWDFIKPLWRAGGLSNYEIARQYEATHKTSDSWKLTVTEAAIRKQARSKGWKKDLAEEIRKRTEEKLVRKEVRTDPVEDEQIIEDASEARVRVIESQREGIKKLKAKRDDILSMWNTKKLSLMEYSTVYRNLVMSESKLNEDERKLHGITDQSKDGESREVKVEMNFGGEKNE